MDDNRVAAAVAALWWRGRTDQRASGCTCSCIFFCFIKQQWQQQQRWFRPGRPHGCARSELARIDSPSRRFDFPLHPAHQSQLHASGRFLDAASGRVRQHSCRDHGAAGRGRRSQSAIDGSTVRPRHAADGDGQLHVSKRGRALTAVHSARVLILLCICIQQRSSSRAMDSSLQRPSARQPQQRDQVSRAGPHAPHARHPVRQGRGGVRGATTTKTLHTRLRPSRELRHGSDKLVALTISL